MLLNNCRKSWTSCSHFPRKPISETLLSSSLFTLHFPCETTLVSLLLTVAHCKSCWFPWHNNQRHFKTFTTNGWLKKSLKTQMCKTCSINIWIHSMSRIFKESISAWSQSFRRLRSKITCIPKSAISVIIYMCARKSQAPTVLQCSSTISWARHWRCQIFTSTSKRESHSLYHRTLSSHRRNRRNYSWRILIQCVFREISRPTLVKSQSMAWLRLISFPWRRQSPCQSMPWRKSADSSWMKCLLQMESTSN